MSACTGLIRAKDAKLDYETGPWKSKAALRAPSSAVSRCLPARTRPARSCCVQPTTRSLLQVEARADCVDHRAQVLLDLQTDVEALLTRGL